MAWEEDISKSAPDTLEKGTAEDVVTAEPTQTPRWLARFFKTIGIISYLIAAVVFLLLISARSALQDLSWYFWLMPFLSFGLFVLVGYGLYKLMRWIGAFTVLGALLGLDGTLYSILAQGKASDIAFFVSLIFSILYVLLAYVFWANRRYFSGEYFHPLYSSAVLTLIIVLTIVSWSSSKSLLDFLNKERFLFPNQQNVTNLSQDQVETMIKAFNYPLTVENKFSINFPGEPQHTTQSVSIPGTTASLVEDKYAIRDTSNRKEYTLTVLEFPSSETLDQSKLEKIINNNIAILPSAYVGDNQPSLTPINIQGHQGLDFAIINQSGNVWIMGRYLIEGHTLYEIKVIYTQGTYHPNDLGAFVNSFKLETQTNSVSSVGENTTTETTKQCKDFSEFSNYVLKTIQQPDSQNVMKMNPYVITSFRWKRKQGEPFVAYPIVKGIQAFYGDQNNFRSNDNIVSAIRNSSNQIQQTISENARNLSFVPDSLSTLALRTFSDKDVLHVLAFSKEKDIYNIVLEADWSYQAPGQGTVTVTCGRSILEHDKVYDMLNLKKDPAVEDNYNNDYVAISDVSSDNKVYAITGSSNHINIAEYYYFDGASLELVSKDSYPTQCAPLEYKKVGRGMRCSDPNYTQSVVSY